ncbi:MAG: hypothetical protein LQ346_003892 [Caloplaca aetnensis]|nr:MAG: hypothetical protein LQ346_003892 [Caloplaca aetnensis]
MDGVDERPLAVRRKRRTTSGPLDPPAQPVQEANTQQLGAESTTENASREPPKTPGNRKKRLRFSDPIERISSSSTGLTPALNRTRLLPSNSTQSIRKRLSLPTQLTRPVVSPLSPQFPNSLSTTYQFAPLRQAIDPRMMRRLRRNHMADEINNVYAERRAKSKLVLQQEVEDLRRELALARDPGNEASDTTEATPESAERIAELENELFSLKQEMQEQPTAIDTAVRQHVDDDETMTFGDSASDGPGSHEQVVVLEDENSAAFNTDQTRSPTTGVEASTQVDLPSPTLSDICRSARLSFEYLFPGENTIGLDVSDPQPLIGAIISRAETLKAELALAEQKLTVTETSQTNMGKNFKDALARLESARSHFDALKEACEGEKERARASELEASTMEARWQNSNDKRRDAEQHRDENRRSIERLQPALEYYQHEVKELTQTIIDLETSHEAVVKDLRVELADDSDAAQACQQIAFEEAKWDLEAQVAAETIGRRKAEQSAVERLHRIKELENLQAELRSAVNEKQCIIRNLEAELENTKSGHESEVGQLNVRIGKLVSDLSSTNAELTATRNEATRLADLVEQEKAAGLRAVEAMQREMKQCSSTVDAVKDTHAEGVKKRGEEVAQSFGLMTPVIEGGKFRDAEADEKVEGHVQFVRGKKRMSRPDSGVEVWGSIVEEGEEDMSMEG